MSRIALRTSALACALLAGCATNAPLPPQFDVRQAAVMAEPTATVLSLDGPRSKGNGAVQGAAKGGGLGVVMGGMACMGTGFLAPLCLATVVPAGLGLGALTGAVVGAVTAESHEAVNHKRESLATELVQWQRRGSLAEALHHKVRPAAVSPSEPNSSVWQVKVALTELATVGSGPDAPYALQAAAKLQVQRAGHPQPLMIRQYHALTPTRLTAAQWGANASAPLREALDELQQRLVDQMVDDLHPTHPRR